MPAAGPPFEDLWGPQQVGMRAVHVPHSTIPTAQRGHTDGEPDAVARRLAELPGILARWAWIICRFVQCNNLHAGDGSRTGPRPA